MSNTIEFNILGSAGFDGTLNDRRKKYYQSLGFNNEYFYLASLGYTGTLNDMRYQLATANGLNMSGFLLAGGTAAFGASVGNFDLSAFNTTPFSSLSTAAIDATITGVWISNDGTEMFMCGGTGINAYHQTLATPWDVSSGGATTTFSLSTWITDVKGIALKPDGTKMYITDGANVDVTEFTLTTPFDLSTAAFVTQQSISDTFLSSPQGFSFSPDGDKAYSTGAILDSFVQFTLSTPWDISTATKTGHIAIGGQTGVPSAIAVSGDGLKGYIGDSANHAIYEYIMTTEFDVSTMSYNSVSQANPVAANDIDSLYVDPTGTYMVVQGNQDDTIKVYLQS